MYSAPMARTNGFNGCTHRINRGGGGVEDEGEIRAQTVFLALAEQALQPGLGLL